ncbi:MAG: hypothetical protein PHQ04_12370 [Opitutaceae bacterium]|nr:hypothetical protein [Opitutaceae bacterium]
MTETEEKLSVEATPRTGHRPGRDPEEPRNSTVCFMVSESEKELIDILGMCMNLRRSAILTHIVTAFLHGAIARKGKTRSKRELLDFLEECREAVDERPDLVNSFLVGG